MVRTLYKYLLANGYINQGGSIQNFVNAGEDKTVNHDNFCVVRDYMDLEGWDTIFEPNDFIDMSEDEEMTKKKELTELGDIELGDRVRYILRKSAQVVGDYDDNFIPKGDVFRTGGWLIDLGLNDEEPIESYMVYQGHNKNESGGKVQNYYTTRDGGGTGMTVQLYNIQYLFVLTKARQNELLASRPIAIDTPGDITNYPISLPDGNGSMVIIKYCRDNAHRNRFINGITYQRASNAGWRFK